ncbi:MAG TPA: hypothetical protein VGB44_12665 [Flavobacterium sp.]|jgi:hypothetical protein
MAAHNNTTIPESIGRPGGGGGDGGGGSAAAAWQLTTENKKANNGSKLFGTIFIGCKSK